jgi:hypothetical protein
VNIGVSPVQRLFFSQKKFAAFKKARTFAPALIKKEA